jgi:hypothetical protein
MMKSKRLPGVTSVGDSRHQFADILLPVAAATPLVDGLPSSQLHS